MYFGSLTDLNEMATKLSAKKLKKQQVTVERCEVNYSVYVSGITMMHLLLKMVFYCILKILHVVEQEMMSLRKLKY